MCVSSLGFKELREGGPLVVKLKDGLTGGVKVTKGRNLTVGLSGGKGTGINFMAACKQVSGMRVLSSCFKPRVNARQTDSVSVNVGKKGMTCRSCLHSLLTL